MTRFVAFASLLTLSILAFSQAKASPTTNLNMALQNLRSSNQLPVLVAHPNPSLLANTESIPEEVNEIFKQIQKFVFGKDSLIALKACNGCQAIADADSMSVYLEPDFLKTLNTKYGVHSKQIIAFIVAHEISHFSYEYITVSAYNKLSPNGNIPLLTKSFTDFVDLSKFATMSPDKQLAETMKYLVMAGKAHSEIDLLGLLSLKGMDIQASQEAIKYLQDEVSQRTSEELAQTDFELRLKTVTEAVANGGL